MTGEVIKKDELMALFEAAHWAPSSYNNQPWRFVYAVHSSKHWDAFLALMVDFNRQWAGKASALVVVLSKKTFDSNNKPSRTHHFDTGAAWQNLALEAVSRGFVAHGMEGFDYEKAREVLSVPEDYDVEAMVAIGVHGNKEGLPEGIREREAPSNRKELKEVVMEGKFRA